MIPQLKMPPTSGAPPFHEISAGNEIPSSEEYCADTDSTLQDEIKNSHDSECEFPGQDSGGEIIMQLKEKFHSTDGRSEKVKILTVLPKSWSVRKIAKEFEALIYMARQAKKLVLEKGILSSSNPKPGKALPDRTQQLVLDVYLSDEISRMLPGRKDCVYVMTAEGKRVSRQKRLLLCNLKEEYHHFRSIHPDIRVGFSTFASLRPKECVLAGASGTHCIKTQNRCLLGVKNEEKCPF